MFTSLRSRLWLSYAFVITIALGIVLIVLFGFLIRNPLLSRQVQEQLRNAQNQISASPQRFVNDPASLKGIAQTHDVRILVFNAARQVIFDSSPGSPSLPFPRRNILARDAQTSRDANGAVWLYTFKRVAGDRVFVVAAPRPRVPVLNILTDQLLWPVVQGGFIALLLSLVLAFAISRWVADPLQQLVTAARSYPSERSSPIPASGPHEVQDLTHAFNSMVTRVESSQKSQRDFVANVSHELKTPLTSIQGFAQAILDDTASTPETRKQAAQIIFDEAGRMHRMALDLLDLARLEAGTADLIMAPVDLVALLNNIRDRFTPLAQRVGVHLRLTIPEQLPTLIGDGDRLAQVFTNLVDNALKFTPADGEVTISTSHAAEDIQVSIMDTGRGVPPQALSRLFERFYQVDPARTGGETAAGRRGAGLGLAIAQEIVQAHGGRISVRSEVGSGTTFVIDLPLAQK